MNICLFCGVLVGALVVTGSPALGQDGNPGVKELQKQLNRLTDRLDTMEQAHRDDQARIQSLENQLANQAPPTASPPGADPWEEAMGETLQTLVPTDEGGGTWGQGNLYNPAITAHLDMGGGISSNKTRKDINRLNLREAELDIRGAVAPMADAVLILTMGEEISTLPGGGIDINRVFDIEEGYVNFHSLPHDLTLKVGKFRNAFGQNNRLHTHALPQVTRPLAVEAFLGPEGLATTGASLSWLVPNPWDKYFELTAEVVNANGGPESPILGGPNADNPAIVTHFKFFDDVGENGTLELGGSYLYARTSDNHKFDANLFGLDATYLWIDPDAPDDRSLLLQSEFFWAANDIENSPFGSLRNHSFGYYAFAQYQFDRNWFTGVRFDYTEFPDLSAHSPGDADWAISPYLTWYPFEFIRLRAEYQHRNFEVGGIRDDEDNFLLGLSFTFGAHPTHPYFVNR